MVNHHSGNTQNSGCIPQGRRVQTHTIGLRMMTAVIKMRDHVMWSLTLKTILTKEVVITTTYVMT